ncbi:hypothetical protein FACS1894154_08370 [Betaproteobacteria bacterium]|nr:hypothetical protein FACS1894154_08370 [Betaproteobacteria bacterium]
MTTKQNGWADILDMLTDEHAEGLGWLIGFFVFVGIWIMYGSFWFAIIAAPLFTLPVVAAVVFPLLFLAMIFERRDSDLNDAPPQ